MEEIHFLTTSTGVYVFVLCENNDVARITKYVLQGAPDHSGSHRSTSTTKSAARKLYKQLAS